MKKLIALVLSSLIILTLASCDDYKAESNYENLWDFDITQKGFIRADTRHVYAWSIDYIDIHLHIKKEDPKNFKKIERISYNNKVYFREDSVTYGDGIVDGNWVHYKLYHRNYYHYYEGLSYNLELKFIPEEKLDIIPIETVEALIYFPEQTVLDKELGHWVLDFSKDDSIYLNITVSPGYDVAKMETAPVYEGFEEVRKGEFTCYEKRINDTEKGKLQASIIWHSDIGKISLDAEVPDNQSHNFSDDVLDFVNFSLARKVYSCIKGHRQSKMLDKKGGL